MKAKKEEGRADWSDFELAIDEIILDRPGEVAGLKRDLAELQVWFSEYLSLVITPDLVNRLDRESQERQWALRTFSQFAADLSEQQYPDVHFLDNVQHRDIFAFDVFNLNYTSLADTYLFLDRKQFSPTRYRSTDRNFEFRINPRDYDHCGGCNYNTGCSAYILTDFHHPHGMQSVPRSLLFGTGGKNGGAEFEKPYWAQLDRKYGSIIGGANLFIVFGCSLGETDRWWWLKIVERLDRDRRADLLIYKWAIPGREREEVESETRLVFMKFVEEYLGRESDGRATSEEVSFLMEQVFVIVYGDAGELSAFGFSVDGYDPMNRSELID